MEKLCKEPVIVGFDIRLLNGNPKKFHVGFSSFQVRRISKDFNLVECTAEYFIHCKVCGVMEDFLPWETVRAFEDKHSSCKKTVATPKNNTQDQSASPRA